MPATCPTPGKTRFATQEAAQLAASRYAKTLTAYHCECDWWHLTSKASINPTPDAAATRDVANLNDTDFQTLVGVELRDQASPQQAAALRDPINLDRWIAALADTSEDISQQIAARIGDRSPTTTDWRRRVLAIQRNLRQRRTEANTLRQQAHAAAGRERATRAAAGMTVNQLRALAGERATQRLIDNHQAEFTSLLVEEFKRNGLEIPTRIARHAARHASQQPAA
ncbi:hypothetical protein ACWEO1_22770 [Kitasatospora cineracea]